MMRDSKNDLMVTMEDREQGILIREAEWGDMNVSMESFKAGVDSAPVFRGLPDDRCQCPHWGYVVSGRMRIRYKDHEEVIGAGDPYYLAPGHTTLFEEDTQVVEFSPKGEYAKTLEVVARNMAAALEQAAGL
jgi:hypothetical protein